MAGETITGNKVYSFIGIAAKAGAIRSGGSVCEDTLRRGSTGLLIVARDAAYNTKKKFLGLASKKGIESRLFGTCVGLGQYCGKSHRSVMLICGESFEKRLIELIDGTAEPMDYLSR